MKFLKKSEGKREKKPLGFKASGDASIGIGFGKELKGNASFGLTPVDDKGSRVRKVFITHGKNRNFLEPIKQIIIKAGMDPVVALEQQSISQPLTDKIMAEMKSSHAAIIHIDDEKRLTDSSGKEQIMLNENVLIEIGVSLALYHRKFILLVKEGIELPSNLKGLYEVRYRGDSLDEDTKERLTKAIGEMRK